MKKELSKILSAFFIGLGFCAGIMACLFIFDRFKVFENDEKSEDNIVYYPKDIKILSHNSIKHSEKFTVSGELEFDDREKYSDATIIVRTFEGETYLGHCFTVLVTKYHSDYFIIPCNINNTSEYGKITYKIEIAKASIAEQ